MAKTSLSALVAAMAPKRGRVVHERGEEVDGEDERLLVVEPVDGGVVGRGEADEEVLGGRRDEAGEQLLAAGPPGTSPRTRPPAEAGQAAR